MLVTNVQSRKSSSAGTKLAWTKPGIDGERVEAHQGGCARAVVEGPVQLGTLVDPVPVDRQLGGVARKLEQDARDAGDERSS